MDHPTGYNNPSRVFQLPVIHYCIMLLSIMPIATLYRHLGQFLKLELSLDIFQNEMEHRDYVQSSKRLFAIVKYVISF